jgi:hypothetical protein
VTVYLYAGNNFKVWTDKKMGKVYGNSTVVGCQVIYEEGLIYDEIREYLTIYDEAFRHDITLHPIPSKFLFFLTVRGIS